MKKSFFEFKNPKFVKTAIWPKDYPEIKNDRGEVLPEIAVIGRSNVGKSTLLNDLFLTKKMVKTSSTPGKTQAINFFTLNEELMFVDLPGYGYAKVSHELQKDWGQMMQKYLEGRPQLQLLLFLIDIRRVPNDDDFQIIDWAFYHEKPLILVLTKIDKINRSQRAKTVEGIITNLNITVPHVLYSVPKKEGREELILLINQHLIESPYKNFNPPHKE